MESYLIYIGKVALAAGGFYITFLLLFQNQKQFRFNRIYLPLSLLASFIIPLITFTSVQYVEPISSLNFNNIAYLSGTTETIPQSQFVLDWYHYLFGFYILGTLGFLFHLLLGHLKALHIIRFSRIKSLFGAKVNVTNKDVHPFSFFNKIVLSKNTLDRPELEIIVNHEKIHVTEKHTFDILFAEILFLFQWFNPFAWLVKDAIKNNLEYITDDKIAEKHNPETYQMAMLALADKDGIAPFLTALNGSQLKSRIIMMKKKSHNKYAILKQLVILPLLAILVMGLSNKEVKTEFIQTEEKAENITHFEDSLKLFDNEIVSQVYDNGIFTLQDYGKDAPLLFLNGKEVIEKVIFVESDLKFAQVIKPKQAIEQYGDRGKNGVLLFNTEDEYEKRNPLVDLRVQLDGKEISMDNPELKKYDTTNGFDSGDIIDALKLDGNKVEATALSFNDGDAVLYIRTTDYRPGTNVEFEKVLEAEKKAIETKVTYYAVDNEIVSKAFFEKYGKDGFESVIILTGKDASEKYGNNYETVVDATSGGNNFKITSEHIVKGKVTDRNGKPIYGVSVIVKDKNTGTITDSSGDYEIELEEENETLIFTRKVCETQEIGVDGKTEINVKLEYTLAGEVLYGDPTLAEQKEKEFKIEGKVTDRNGKPISGVSVIVKGKNSGTITNSSGDYEIELEKENEVLIFLMIGFKTQEIEVAGKTEVNVKLVAEQIKKNGSEIFYKAEEMPQFPGGEKALENYISKSIKYPKIAAENGIWGTVHVSFIIDKNGKVNNPQISLGVDPSLDKEALRVVNALPRWKPGKQRGKIVNVSYTVPVDFVITTELIREYNKLGLDGKPLKKGSATKGDEKGEIAVVGYAVPSSSENIDFNKIRNNKNEFDFGVFDGRHSGPPLYIVDGKIEETSDKIDPDKIERVDVLKGESATSVYGEKGKNGVIIITTKRPIENDKLLIVDGEEFVGDLKDISANEIESISILKEISATQLYGSKGKNGVIIIKTKDENYVEPIYFLDGKKVDQQEAFNFSSSTQLVKEVITLSKEEAKKKYGKEGENGAVEIYSKINPTTVDLIFSASPGKDKPLVLVDGKKFRNINVIDPVFIKSVNVLKDIAAIEKYKDLGKNGVIEVTLKKPEELTQNEIPVVLNGDPTDKKMNEIDGDLIEQIKKIEVSEAVKKYGDFGKFGVLEVSTKE